MSFLQIRSAAGVFAVVFAVGGLVPAAGASQAGQTTGEFLKSTSIEESVERSRRNRNFYEPTRAQMSEVGRPGGGAASATPPTQHGLEPTARPDAADRRARKREAGIRFGGDGPQDLSDYASPEPDRAPTASPTKPDKTEHYWFDRRSRDASQDRSRRQRGESGRF